MDGTTVAGRRRPEWPLWHAEYLREKLAPPLDASFTKSEVESQIFRVASEHPLEAPDTNWARYCARFFIRLHG